MPQSLENTGVDDKDFLDKNSKLYRGLFNIIVNIILIDAILVHFPSSVVGIADADLIEPLINLFGLGENHKKLCAKFMAEFTKGGKEQITENDRQMIRIRAAKETLVEFLTLKPTSFSTFHSEFVQYLQPNLEKIEYYVEKHCNDNNYNDKKHTIDLALTKQIILGYKTFCEALFNTASNFCAMTYELSQISCNLTDFMLNFLSDDIISESLSENFHNLMPICAKYNHDQLGHPFFFSDLQELDSYRLLIHNASLVPDINELLPLVNENNTPKDKVDGILAGSMISEIFQEKEAILCIINLIFHNLAMINRIKACLLNAGLLNTEINKRIEVAEMVFTVANMRGMTFRMLANIALASSVSEVVQNYTTDFIKNLSNFLSLCAICCENSNNPTLRNRILDILPKIETGRKMSILQVYSIIQNTVVIVEDLPDLKFDKQKFPTSNDITEEAKNKLMLLMQKEQEEVPLYKDQQVFRQRTADIEEAEKVVTYNEPQTAEKKSSVSRKRKKTSSMARSKSCNDLPSANTPFDGSTFPIKRSKPSDDASSNTLLSEANSSQDPDLSEKQLDLQK